MAAETRPTAVSPSSGARAVSPSSAASTTRTGPLGEGGAAATSCVEGYSMSTLPKRAFAFDGTINGIGPGGTNRPDKGRLETAAVTFTVNEWFKGGTARTITVDLMAPPSRLDDSETPAYEAGTRLLVSGEPRWGGAALDDAIAWSCGGFTRYYEPSVAADWRAATS